MGKNRESGVPSVLLKHLIDAVANQIGRGIKFRLEIVTLLWSPNQRGNHSNSWNNDPRLDDVYGMLVTMLCQVFLSAHFTESQKNICYRVVMKYQYTSIRCLLSIGLNHAAFCVTWAWNVNAHYFYLFHCQIKREISTMKLIKHPNVVQLHEVSCNICADTII
jgi:hypothetical protein